MRPRLSARLDKLGFAIPSPICSVSLQRKSCTREQGKAAVIGSMILPSLARVPEWGALIVKLQERLSFEHSWQDDQRIPQVASIV